MSWFRFFKFKIILCEPSFFGLVKIIGLVKIGDRIWSVLASQGETERIFFPANFWISEWMIFLSLWISLGWAVWKAGNSASSTNSSFTPLTNCNISPSEVSPSQTWKKNVSVYPLQTEIHLNAVHPSTAGVSGSKCIPGRGVWGCAICVFSRYSCLSHWLVDFLLP